MEEKRREENSMLSDQQQRRSDGQKFDDDVAQKEGDNWLSEDTDEVSVSENVTKSLNCTCSETSSQQQTRQATLPLLLDVILSGSLPFSFISMYYYL